MRRGIVWESCKLRFVKRIDKFATFKLFLRATATIEDFVSSWIFDEKFYFLHLAIPDASRIPESSPGLG